MVVIPRHGHSFTWAKANGADALIHLAGRNIASRWSLNFKTTMLAERKAGIESLSKALAKLKNPPPCVVIASAIGYYGETWQAADESAPLGTGFASQVCDVLEHSGTYPRATRVVFARIGVVLHPTGGALAQMLPVFKLGLGGRVGNGKQIFSWVSRPDVCRALLHIVQTPSLKGPVNLVAPNPLPQTKFAKSLGQVLHRPTFLPMPALMVKLLFGQMGTELLLQSCAVSANTLVQSGFTFQHPTLKIALKAIFKPES